ncbi:MAG: NUDIX hydrolase [Nostocoides sp.]
MTDLVVDVLERLRHFTPDSPAQSHLRDTYAALVNADPGALFKSGPPTHLTASCLVIDPSGERVLLTHHRRARAWFQFGGHLEPSDISLHAAATREAREESGIPDLVVCEEIIQLDRHTLAGDFGPCREHLDVRFLAIAEPDTTFAASPESYAVAWTPVGQLTEVAPTVLPLAEVARRVLHG